MQISAFDMYSVKWKCVPYFVQDIDVHKFEQQIYVYMHRKLYTAYFPCQSKL